MVGSTVSETKRNVMAALGQFHRLLKPGGDLWIFDLAPVPPASLIERLCWNLLRSVLGNGLDMYFWTVNGLARLVGEVMPNARMEGTFFPTLCAPRSIRFWLSRGLRSHVSCTRCAPCWFIGGSRSFLGGRAAVKCRPACPDVLVRACGEEAIRQWREMEWPRMRKVLAQIAGKGVKDPA
jgi:hypothetical protein